VKHVFLDTNVLIDFLADRQPFSLDAAILFDFSLKRKATLYVSAVSYNNMYYVMQQSRSHTATIKLLNELFDLTVIVPVTKEVISNSLNSDFKDFEDAIQYHGAKTVRQIDCIVTRNTKDYRKSSIPVLTPREAVTMIDKDLSSTHG
jgi:predicted nucleic acid-binding protein